MMTKPKIFLSYSHEDEAWKELVLKHLHVPERQALLEVWADERIEGGARWNDQILGAIDSARVAVLLVSANFLGSEFILDVEVPRMLKRLQAGRLKILPVLVRPCLWPSVPWLAELQIRPWNGVALAARRGHRLDTELAAIAEEVLELARPGTPLSVAEKH